MELIDCFLKHLQLMYCNLHTHSMKKLLLDSVMLNKYLCYLSRVFTLLGGKPLPCFTLAIAHSLIPLTTLFIEVSRKCSTMYAVIVLLPSFHLQLVAESKCEIVKSIQQQQHSVDDHIPAFRLQGNHYSGKATRTLHAS